MGIYVFILVLILITSVLLTLVVLVQNSKGGGLASNFAGSSQVMGVRQTADFLEKATWTLSIVLMALSLFAVIAIPNQASNAVIDTELREQIDEVAPIPSEMVPPPQNNQ
jgi:preprotein translocase subunit SecG